MLIFYVKGVINHLPVLKDYGDECLFILVLTPVLLSLPSFLNKLCFFDYLFFFINVLSYLSCYVFFPDNSEWLTEYVFMCTCCVFPFYFIGRALDIDKAYNIFVLLSALCIYIDLLFYLVYAPRNRAMNAEVEYDNMWAAYQILPHVCMMLWATLEKFSLWKSITFFLGLMFLLSCGTRGPFVCLGFYGIIYFFFYMKFKGAIYVKTGIIAITFIIALHLKEILYLLVKTFTNLQLSTRILDKIISGELGNDSQRGALRDILYTALESGDQFWGLGYFGTMRYGIIYSHFLPLDFFCNYGYLMGSILLILLFATIGAAFWITRGQRTQIFIVFLFSISIIKLLLSNTFILEPYFFMLIGICVREILFRIQQKNRTLKYLSK